MDEGGSVVVVVVMMFLEAVGPRDALLHKEHRRGRCEDQHGRYEGKEQFRPGHRRPNALPCVFN